MKKIKILILLLFITNLSFAQDYLSLTYLKVPREKMSEFLGLHKEMVEAQVGENRLLNGHWVFAHRFAANYSLLVVQSFNDPADINKNQALSRQNSNKYASTLSEEESKAFKERRSSWLSMYLEGHYDEVRYRHESAGFRNENFDNTNSKVVVISWYNPSYANMKEFREIYEKQKISVEKELGNSEKIITTAHFSGRSPTFSSVMWYPSWEVFAKNEAALDEIQANGDNSNGGRMWEIAGGHWDEILVTVGHMNEGKFVIAK